MKLANGKVLNPLAVVSVDINSFCKSENGYEVILSNNTILYVSVEDAQAIVDLIDVIEYTFA